MAIWRRLESWLSWFPWYRRQARDADLARELRDHLDLEADEQRAAGLSPEEAGYAAHRALGNTLRIEDFVMSPSASRWPRTYCRFGPLQTPTRTTITSQQNFPKPNKTKLKNTKPPYIDRPASRSGSG